MSIQTKKIGRLTVRVDYDFYPTSPREDYTLATFVLDGGPRYDLPNEIGIDLDPSWSAYTDSKHETMNGVARHLVRHYDAHPGLIFAVTLIDNGGQSSYALKSAYPFSPGDIGGVTVGLAFMDRDTFEQFTPYVDDEGREVSALQAAKSSIAGELAEYEAYANGAVYGFTVEDFDGEVLESVFGLIGDSDFALSEGVQIAESYATALPNKCNGELDRASGNVDHYEDCPIHNELRAQG